MLRGLVHLQFGNELRLHLEHLRRRRRQLLARLLEPYQLRRVVPRFVQCRLHRKFHLHGDCRRQRQRFLQR
jgi:hypothetical protein